jgi:hypothetical protein
MRKYLKTGDIFEVNLGNNTKGYVQYIADDTEQLNSSVVRVFKKRYPVESAPSFDEITTGDVEFYSHITDIKHGEKDGTWRKVGKSEDIGDIKKPIFRSCSEDITMYSPSHLSKHWYVWRIGEESQTVRPGNKVLEQSDIGMVIWPESIKERMETGKYHAFFPKFEGEK